MTADRSAGSDACPHTEYTDGRAPDAYPKTGAGATGVEGAIWDALATVQDPEMPVSVVDLGLIYDVSVDRSDGEGRDLRATIEMTLTYSGCPARDVLVHDVERAAATVPSVADVDVRLRYSPPWNVEMVTEDGRDALRRFGVSV
ncbi:MAG: 1,2-phenylacetyl-CoA epoxidase subunit PaaD [Halobacteriota archaeon]